MNKKRKEIIYELNKDNLDLSLIQNNDQDEVDFSAPDSKKLKQVGKKGEESIEDDDDEEDDDEEEEKEEEKPKESSRITKYKLIVIIRLYIEWFPQKLDGFKEIDLKELETEELQRLLDDIRIIIKANNLCSFNRGAMLGASNLLENIAVASGFDIRGLSIDLEKEQDFQDLIKEIALENAESGFTLLSPLQRGLVKLVESAGKRYMINGAEQLIQRAKSFIVNQAFIDKFRDL